mmetsp:Transcript_12471/g.9070  ORF Transcript_12471/g.9070 Transcript_12471/m.9070 type:complete len:91 (+) Transcript_12471:223-495(+)
MSMSNWSKPAISALKFIDSPTSIALDERKTQSFNFTELSQGPPKGLEEAKNRKSSFQLHGIKTSISFFNRNQRPFFLKSSASKGDYQNTN